MRACVLMLLLSAACVSGEDPNNCVAAACGGCCGIGGKCEEGFSDRACGRGARACVDCTLTGQRCDEVVQGCTSAPACGSGLCNTGSGTSTPCCPITQPCSFANVCSTRANARPGATCCR
jgi:hypothetical protein